MIDAEARHLDQMARASSLKRSKPYKGYQK